MIIPLIVYYRYYILGNIFQQTSVDISVEQKDTIYQQVKVEMYKTSIIVILVGLLLMQSANYVAAALAIEYKNTLYHPLSAYYNVLQQHIVFIIFTTTIAAIFLIIVTVLQCLQPSPGKKKGSIILSVAIAMFQFGLAICYHLETGFNNEFFGDSGTNEYQSYYLSFRINWVISDIAGILTILLIWLMLSGDGIPNNYQNAGSNNCFR